MHGQCREDISPQSSGSRVNPGNDDERKRVSLAAGNWSCSNSNFKSGNCQEYRQERVILAARKLWQKDQTRAKSEENSSCTRKLDASSPEMENMTFSNSQYVTKTFQCLQKKLGRSSIDATFSIEIIQNKCDDMEIVHGRHRWKPPFISWTGVPKEFGNQQKHKIRDHWECVQPQSKIYQRTFWRNSECEKPGLFLAIMDVNDQAIKWAKAKVCVCADSVLCVGRQEQGPEAIARWKGQVQDLKGYQSYQDAVGIDGKAIEFEWKNFRGFTALTVLQQIQKDMQNKNIPPEKFEDRIIFMSMFNGLLWKKHDQNCISNAEQVKDYVKKFKSGHWTFLGPGSGTRWCGDSRWTVGSHSQQQFKETGHPIFICTSDLSRGVLKRRNGKSTIRFNGGSKNTELLFQTIHSVNQISFFVRP